MFDDTVSNVNSLETLSSPRRETAPELLRESIGDFIQTVTDYVIQSGGEYVRLVIF